MGRLTNKIYNTTFDAEFFEKLKKFEDIEQKIGEELDIDDFDLLFVLKVITSFAFFRDMDGQICKANKVRFDFEDGTFSFHHRNNCHFDTYENYKKTWWLDKNDIDFKEQ